MTPAEIVSQAEGSNAGSTPDYNNNDTFRSTSTISRQSSEISEENEPKEVAKTGSVVTDSHTPVERERLAKGITRKTPGHVISRQRVLSTNRARA